MKPTLYPDVNSALNKLLDGIRQILKAKLVGLYLDGSLVIGDYDPGISDIDLVASISGDITDPELSELLKFHSEFAIYNPDWDDRIEVCYITVKALGKVRSETSTIVNISPGEPLHRKESSKEWLSNWYLTREKSITLFGPSPKEIIESISKDEFIQSIVNHVRSWDKWLHDMPKNSFAQSYVILTLCRALYTYRNGDQVSKKHAALWAKKELPEWQDIIQNALIWRNGPKHSAPDEAAFVETKKFVDYIRKLILEA